MPEISVIVPHLNQPGPLADCLAALARQTLAPGRFEVVVVDNGSTVPPAAVVAGLAGARLLSTDAPGPGPARNLGAARTRGAILAFIDADCRPEPGWLAALSAAFGAAPERAVLGGTVRVFPADPRHPAAAEAFDMLYGFRQALQIARLGFAATANLAVRRTIFEAVGPFAGIEVAEDMDWCRRARAAGFPIGFAPEAVVSHPARGSVAELRRQWDRNIGHFWRMRRDGPGGRALWAARSFLIALSPVAEIPRVLASDRISGPRARAGAFAVLVRIRLYRARRMLAALVDPAARQGGTHWNRP